MSERGMTSGPAGPVLDALGVELKLRDGQQVTECVLIGKVADFSADDPGTALVIATSKGLDWVAQRGLVTAGLWALDTGTCGCGHSDEDDD